MRKYAAAAALAVLVAAHAPAAHAQKKQQQRAPSAAQELQSLREQVKELQEGQASMQQDLQEIKRLLMQVRAAAPPGPQGPPMPTSVSLDTDPHLGNDAAKVVLIDFSDYQCPFCARYFHDTMPQIDKDYISTGKVKYVFRDLPIESIHPHAFKAAVAADCAGEQGKFWEMHNKLFDNQRQLDPASLNAHAQAIGLDTAKFAECLASNKYDGEIRKDMDDARAANIGGTPNFVIGIVNPKDPRDPNIIVLKTITGAQPYPVFKAALDAALESAGVK